METSAITLYNFNGGNIRTLTIGEEPWFLGNDVSRALEYKIPQKAVTDHVASKHRQVLSYRAFSKTDKADLWQGNDYSNKVIIDEPGMYSLVMHSKSSRAEEFQEWVTSEVLPSIRKHGAYMTESTLNEVANNPDLLIKLANNLKSEQLARQEAENKLEQQKPKVEFADAVGNSKDLISMGDMANILSKNGIDIGRTRLFRWAREKHIIKQHGSTPTQWAINMGIIKVQETHNIDKYGHEHLQMTARVTPKGQKYILQKFDIVGGEINLLENN